MRTDDACSNSYAAMSLSLAAAALIGSNSSVVVAASVVSFVDVAAADLADALAGVGKGAFTAGSAAV